MDTVTGPPRDIEEVLAGALWVSGLTDPALCLDRLHETFTDVIFSCIPDDERRGGVGGGADERVGRLRTAADRLRDAKAREDLRRALVDLQGHSFVDGGGRAFASGGDEDEEDEEGHDMEDEDMEEDMEDEDSAHLEDEEFLAWLHRNDAQRAGGGAEAFAEAFAAAGDGVELELHRVGLGEDDRRLTEDLIPERLKAIEVRERRPRLGAKRLPHGHTYSIDVEQEAFWVLRQLRGAGQPLAHNTRICAIANRSAAEAADEPVVVAIAYALRMMTREFLEPAHLMLYHQTALHPLLFALLEASPLAEAAEAGTAVASYAYSTRTGRRQRPFLSDAYVGFSAIANRSIGEGDAAWERVNIDDEDFAQRKPCFIELGRLLVRILELDVLCHRLEFQRQQMLLKLRESPQPSVQEQRVALENIVFESAVEADLWQTFVTFLTKGSGTGPTHTIRALGIEDAFEEYTLNGVQYQENLLANAPIYACQPQATSIVSWAEEVGAKARVMRGGDAVLTLFNQAIVEQFSRLPFLRKRLFDVFCAEGDLIVTNCNCRRSDEVYPLASFFVDHPRHYLELLERERHGGVALHYVISDDLVRRELSLRELYDRSIGSGDEWAAEREKAMDLLIVRLIDGLVPKVKSELSQIAHYCVHTHCAERLGTLCAQGPYEPTRLCISGFDEHVLTWDPEWNIVESLPAAPQASQTSGKQLLARVCAAYRGDNGVTHFSFIDEAGVLLGATRWADCAMHSESGRAADMQQNSQLERLFVKYSPSVIAVGAGNMTSLTLMRSVERFVKERVHGVLRVHVPIVWAPVEVARLCGSAHFADVETPSADMLARTSLALARHVQDPLSAVCALFDKSHTALRLSLGAAAFTTSEQEEMLHARLAWEMSLWVTACGVALEDCVRRPNAVAVLQFVAGLGPAKARQWERLLSAERPASRVACRALLAERFGEYVARNAVAALRIAPPASGGKSNNDTIAAPPPPPPPSSSSSFSSSSFSSHSGWHVLDQTLVPLEWYGAAELVAGAALKCARGSLALAELIRCGLYERRDRLDRYAHQRDMADAVRLRRRSEWDGLRGEREVELLQEEMVAAGRSFMRRPFRRLSFRELMACITGITYCPRRAGDAAMPTQSAAEMGAALFLAENNNNNNINHINGVGGFAPRALFVCEGDFVAGTVVGIRGGERAPPAVRLATSRGLPATIAADDIPDETMRRDLIQYELALRTARANPGPDTRVKDVPAWLQRNALIQGIAIGCYWERCELRLRWCRPPAADTNDTKDTIEANGARGAEDGAAQRVASYAAPGPREGHGDQTSSVNSLRTVCMEAEVRVFATKISRHPFFRDVSRAQAQAYLHDKKVGEVILRPATGRRSKAIAVVKFGDWSTCNWLISEDRRSSGAIFYSLTDKVTERTLEFGDVDEFLNSFVAPMAELVQTIRQHRRFVPHARDVPDALESQRKSGVGFTYAFAETGNQARPPFYRVFTRAGNAERNYHLHVDDSSIYVRVPVRRSGGGGGASGLELKWVKCRNAEHVSEVVKSLARSR